MDTDFHATIDIEALVAEIYRYLAVVECFRREGYTPGRTAIRVRRRTR